MNPIYEHRDKVRDYECDLQGIVNNANYQHYLEHARHEFLLANEVSFSEMHERGIDPVVARIAMDFKVPLRSRDEYITTVRVEKEGIRFVFRQEILRASDRRLCVRARVDCVFLIGGRLSDCEEMNQRFGL